MTSPTCWFNLKSLDHKSKFWLMWNRKIALMLPTTLAVNTAVSLFQHLICPKSQNGCHQKTLYFLHSSGIVFFICLPLYPLSTLSRDDNDNVWTVLFVNHREYTGLIIASQFKPPPNDFFKFLSPCSRDIGHEGLNPQLFRQKGGGVRAGETRPTQWPQESCLYPSVLTPSCHLSHNSLTLNLSHFIL